MNFIVTERVTMTHDTSDFKTGDVAIILEVDTVDEYFPYKILLESKGYAIWVPESSIAKLGKKTKERVAELEARIEKLEKAILDLSLTLDRLTDLNKLLLEK